MSGPLALGVDVGTSAIKVGCYDSAGTRLAVARRPIHTSALGGGAVEQDGAQIWEAFGEAVGEILADAVVDARSIAAIGVDSQYSSVIPVDAQGHPVGPLILWQDTRGGKHNLRIWADHPEMLETWVDRHGIPPLPSGNDSLGHILHVQYDRPEVHASTSSYLEVMDYLCARLTGRVVANQCSAFMFLLTDNRRPRVTEWEPELLEASGVDVSRLPPLVPVDEPLGALRAEVASDLGLSREVVVIPGLNDTQADALSARTQSGNCGGLWVGTTSVIVAHIDHKDTDADHSIVTMPSPLPGRHLVMAENGLGGRVVDWFLDSIACADDPFGEGSSFIAGTERDRYAAFEAALSQVAPGANGVLFLPWLKGAMAPNDNKWARGGFLNLNLSTTRSAMCRAVVEGVALNLSWLLEHVEVFCGRRLDAIRFGGGAATSPGWGRILADVLQRPIDVLIDPTYANCRTMALLALERGGVCDIDDVSCPIDPETRIEPDHDVADRYANAAEVFREALPVTSRLVRSLH